MTIKMERDTMIRVMGGLLSPLSLSGLSSSESPGSTHAPDNVLATSSQMTFKGQTSSSWEPSQLAPVSRDEDEFDSSSGLPDLDDTDDEDSIGSLASSVTSHNASSTSSTSTVSSFKRVSFVEPLVTRVWTRPRTDPRDVRDLFYSQDETQRFRMEYREEKRLQSLEECSTFGTTEQPPPTNSSSSSHRISRVVVSHHNSQQTFFDKEYLTAVSSSSSSSPSTLTTVSSCGLEASEDFFDNASFWSGQITWY